MVFSVSLGAKCQLYNYGTSEIDETDGKMIRVEVAPRVDIDWRRASTGTVSRR